jgi:hypothetical protein
VGLGTMPALPRSPASTRVHDLGKADVLPPPYYEGGHRRGRRRGRAAYVAGWAWDGTWAQRSRLYLCKYSADNAPLASLRLGRRTSAIVLLSRVGRPGGGRGSVSVEGHYAPASGWSMPRAPTSGRRAPEPGDLFHARRRFRGAVVVTPRSPAGSTSSEPRARWNGCTPHGAATIGSTPSRSMRIAASAWPIERPVSSDGSTDGDPSGRSTPTIPTAYPIARLPPARPADSSCPAATSTGSSGPARLRRGVRCRRASMEPGGSGRRKGAVNSLAADSSGRVLAQAGPTAAPPTSMRS